ncbi:MULTISPECIES: hypothetical protein [Agrobacterium]|uniref:Uncharacterized protein n=1 Tax=Agrobacterium tumefaciens TaxID=358 RepID=A0AAE6B9X4_AGRTU|nr:MULTISPECIES: hypothetical protein [Agrobacterium]QCL72578.1 hypothetical protein CFBP5499_03455 [Agrobacterium tumefaciens]QCL78150.1 hypothetical protein CFBP5877_03005 [Agrobacterium tumefaciens]CUX17376.1 conserved hypothetical protein [Agrobacterium sp. NCPPB 925]
MTTIAATTSISYASPVRTLEPTKSKEAHSTTQALLELTRAAHRAISSAEDIATAVSPVTGVAAGASAGLAAALWNLDSGASATTKPTLDMAASVQPEAASGIEAEVLKALAQALGVDEAA